jgi:type IV pilus assembly protein PilY1
MNTSQPSGSLCSFPCAFALGATLAALAYPAQAAVSPAQSPLFLTTSAQPNIMLMLDSSGSMVNIVPEAPYSSSTTYSCASPLNITGAVAGPASSTNLPTNSTISKIDGTLARFYWNGTPYPFSTNCFDPNKIYNADLAEDPANASADSVYTGNYLNWFFNITYGSFNSSGRKIDSSGAIIAPSRIEVAKTASNNFVNSLNNVRLGLSTYDIFGAGGILRAPIANIATNRSTITTAITGASASGLTPLAETLSDIGGYFASPYTGNLTLHPGKTNQATATVANIFNNHTISTASGVTLPSSSCATANPPTCPIQYSCQKSFTVLVTDGMPTLDRSISSYLKDYDGDCSGANASNCNHTPFVSDSNCSSAAACDMKTNGVYEDGAPVGYLPGDYLPSDFLDDVAQALYEMDLRPDLTKTAGQKNNVMTYTIGFADVQVQNNPLIRDAGTQGGGQFIYAEDSAGLTTALQSTFFDIAAKNASASAVATNSTRLDTSAVVYQAKFDSSDWSGQLLAFDLNNTEDLNGNGLLDAGEDADGDGVLDLPNGTIGAQLWDAGASGKIPAAASRKVVTYNPGATGAPRGRDFLWASLTATQQAALNANTTIGGSVTAGNVGQKTLDYIRGDQAQEQTTSPTTGPFRKRTVILGDIVNSDPWFVGSHNFGYDSLPAPEGSSYVTFRNGSTYQQRRRMIYFGANDGMLHGIDAGSYSSGTFNTGTGEEKLAYVPDAVIPNLKNLTSPSYTHQYFVDGSPKVGDAYINSAWKTVLLGTTGAGGKAVFALDVTAPDSFGSSNVLWEISTTTSPTASDRTTDDASVAGFEKNLGYTLPQLSLVRMYDGSWAAIVANGYGSANNKAVLYIINAATGNLIRSINTGVGSSTAGSENGLSTPIALDVDNDRITDYIYAGDLKGNLWKFDVRSCFKTLFQVVSVV